MKKNYPPIPSMIACITGAVLFYFVCSTWVICSAWIKGESMEPTFHDGMFVLVKCYPLIWRGPHRGEIIILRDNDGYKVMKRIAKVPGELDTISPSTRNPRQVLGSNEYLVIGDNAAKSADSRFYGPVKKNQIIGIVWQ